MKIAITADPSIPVPPLLYGGIERIIDMLIKGLMDRGHEVTLFAHQDSQVNCRLIKYPGTSQLPLDVIKNTLTVSSLLLRSYDIVHSFGRLAYLTAILPTKVPKIMSYQREPTLSQVRKAINIARDNTLSFTGCSEYIAKQIRPFAPSIAIPNGVPMDKYTFRASVAIDAPLVFLGRIEYIKGPHLAIDVAIKSGRKLIIAGNIPLDSQSQEYFRTSIQPYLNQGQIEYIGPINDEQKNALWGRLMPF